MRTIYPATSSGFDTTINYPSTDYPTPTYTTGTTTQQTNGWAFFTSQGILNLPEWSNGSGLKPVLLCHGLGGSSTISFQPGSGSWADYPRALADAGFAVLGLDIGTKHFGNNLASNALDQAFTFMTALTGASQVGLIGTSAGGLAALNWLRRRPSNVRATFLVNPFIDSDVLRKSSDWTTPYAVNAGDPNYSLFTGGGASLATASDLNSAYLATTDADWANNAVAQGKCPARIPSAYAGKRIHIAKAQLDGTIPYQQDSWWVGAVNSPTVDLTIYTGATLNHGVNTMLGSGTTDAATIAAGGLPRSALRDFFRSYL